MPSSKNKPIYDEMEFTDSSDEGSDEDPDYIESDSDQSDCDNIAARTQDRCRYIRQYRQELTTMHSQFVQQGQDTMGPAFLQFCDFATFANFCYKCTTP